MTDSTPDAKAHHSNVIDLFSRKPYAPSQKHRFIRLAPELDGLEMLYSNDAHNGKLFSVKILCWGLKEDGEVTGLVLARDEGAGALGSRNGNQLNSEVVRILLQQPAAVFGPSR